MKTPEIGGISFSHEFTKYFAIYIKDPIDPAYIKKAFDLQYGQYYCWYLSPDGVLYSKRPVEPAPGSYMVIINGYKVIHAKFFHSLSDLVERPEGLDLSKKRKKLSITPLKEMPSYDPENEFIKIAHFVHGLFVYRTIVDLPEHVETR